MAAHVYMKVDYLRKHYLPRLQVIPNLKIPACFPHGTQPNRVSTVIYLGELVFFMIKVYGLFTFYTVRVIFWFINSARRYLFFDTFL